MVRLLLLVVLVCLVNQSATVFKNSKMSYRTAVRLVLNARRKAARDIRETERTNNENFMPRPAGCPCAFDTFNSFSEELRVTRNLIGPATLRIETLKNVKSTTNLPVDVLITDPVFLKAWKRVFGCRRDPLPRCNKYSRFRSFDGSCNNLRNPNLGKTFQTQGRFLKPEYVDDIDSPRTRALNGRRLPRVRATSNIIGPNTMGTCFDDENTLAVLSWGGMIIYETLFTPATSTDKRNRPFTCCNKPARRECFTIGVDRDDPFYDVSCIDFVRASPTLFNMCRPGRRQQINQANSYMDASEVYGLSKQVSDSRRVFRRGLLKVDRENFPETNSGRLVEVVTQVALVRLHNMFANRLSRINQRWSDERLYQETRRIIGAIVQKITYEDYLPTFLNEETRKKFCLKFSCQLYDNDENPLPRIGYSVGAGRFGHSTLPPSEEFSANSFISLKQITQGIVNGLVDGILNNSSAKIDRKFEFYVRNKLVLDKFGNSYDLLAINLQRGRDTGLPPYNRWREFCGLPKAVTFSTRRGGLVHHSVENANILQRAYADPEFIDLYVGGLSETPLPGAKVGPTFSCILATQFRAFKVADRFFYNRKDPITGFTRSQVRSIRRVTYGKIICDAFNLPAVQRNIFRVHGRRNPIIPCKKQPSINLNLWKDKKRRYK